MASIHPIRSMDSGGNDDGDVHDRGVDHVRHEVVCHAPVLHLEVCYQEVYCLED